MRREELYTSRSPSPNAHDAELQAALNRQLASLYEITFADPADPVISTSPENNENEFEFRLFAVPVVPSHSGAELSNATARIILEDDVTIDGDGAFVRPHRNPSYYFASTPAEEQRQQYASSAVTGEYVRKQLVVSFPACKMPWKVTVVRARSRKDLKGVLAPVRLADQIPSSVTADKIKSGKLGKKARIRKRQQMRKLQEVVEMEKLKALSKEEAEKEKRARLNRVKKLRKKAKEKALKAAARGEVGSSSMANVHLVSDDEVSEG